MTIPHPTTAHFHLRSGLQSGLDCTMTEYTRYKKYTCGATSCNIYKTDGSWGCTTANTPALLSGSGIESMKKEIGHYNGVAPEEVHLP
jgi:hypothetical protein